MKHLSVTFYSLIFSTILFSVAVSWNFHSLQVLRETERQTETDRQRQRGDPKAPHPYSCLLLLPSLSGRDPSSSLPPPPQKPASSKFSSSLRVRRFAAAFPSSRWALGAHRPLLNISPFLTRRLSEGVTLDLLSFGLLPFWPFLFNLLHKPPSFSSMSSTYFSLSPRSSGTVLPNSTAFPSAVCW